MTISFQPLEKEHFSLLFKWLELPHVKEFWDKSTLWTKELIQEKYSSYVDGYKLANGVRKPLRAYLIYLHALPIGYIHYYNAYDFPSEGYDLKEIVKNSKGENLSLAALDLFIGEKEVYGNGIGSLVIKTFLETYVWPKFDACLVDPEKRNLGAIKAYAKAGFSSQREIGPSIILLARKTPKEKNPIIIFGSSRSDGDTLKAIKAVIQDRSVPIIDLRELSFTYYDYTYANSKDDFLPLAEKMIQHDPIILATPVYWYTMSAIMKTFIDRWSDLLDIRKDIGRLLANKELCVITSYAADTLPKGFEDAFSQSCDYMEMHYKGCLYFYSGEDAERLKENSLLAENFSHRIWNQDAIQEIVPSVLG